MAGNGESNITLLKFWAPWCAPCKAMAPAVESAVKKYASVQLHSVNVDEDPSLAAEHGVRAIPTLVLLKDGEAAARLIGSRSSDEIDRFLSEHQ